MTLFGQIILEMALNESAEITDINSAIDGHNVVHLYYEAQTDHDTATGERDIYPIAYGLSTAGNPVVRAYQPNGDTASSVPSWKLFRLDGIKHWDSTDSKFTTRDIPNLRIGKHDAQMSIEYKSAFGGKYSDTKDVPNIDKQRIDHTPVSSDEIDNVNNITKDMATPAKQVNTVKNEPENLDIPKQTTHIPVGVNQDTIEAPDAKPISHDQLGTDMEPDTEYIQEPDDLESDAPTPIYQDDEIDTEDEYDDEEYDEDEYNVNNDEKAQNIHDLMDRMDNINR